MSAKLTVAFHVVDSCTAPDWLGELYCGISGFGAYSAGSCRCWLLGQGLDWQRSIFWDERCVVRFVPFFCEVATCRSSDECLFLFPDMERNHLCARCQKIPGHVSLQTVQC